MRKDTKEINPESAEIKYSDTKKSIRNIEKDVIDFILGCPLFNFEKMKYKLIIAYFFTRKQLTQEKLKELTGLSAGMVSEGLSYMLKEGNITLKKVKGVRKRFYQLTSISYYYYLQLFQIFKSNSELYSRLDVIYNEMDAKKLELKNIYGYSILNDRVKLFLKMKPLVERLLSIFQEAKERFKIE